jgi:hypothetical protein
MKSRLRRAALLLLALPAGPLLAEGPTVQERLGHPPSARLLVIHADDVGMAHSVNRASFEALEGRTVTSASILVPCPWFPEVAAWARNRPEADLGIHLALNSEWTTLRWGPVLGRAAVPSLLDEAGYLPLVQQPVAERAKLDEVERELRAQVEAAKAAGIRISHLDTHMGTLFFTPGLLQLYLKLGRELGLPVLHERQALRERSVAISEGEVLIDRVLGLQTTVAKEAWPDAYRKLLAPLPAGVYELIVHLAHDDEEMRAATVGHVDFGSEWRQNDFDLVRSPDFRRFLEEQGFVLVSFKDLARALPPDYARGR